MRFRATVQLRGKTASGIVVPEEIVQALGAGKRPAVKVTVKGHTYRSTVSTMAGEFRIPISAENRESAGVAAGDEVDIDLELDTAPREVVVPPDFDLALTGDAEAKRFYDGLSTTHKKAYVLWIEGAKKAETRERRVAEAVTMLRNGQRR
jgi:hypothetical protein